MSDLLSTNDAAAMLKVGASTVKRWADEGRLECLKTAGGHRRFRRADVTHMLTSGLEGGAELTPQHVLDDHDGHACMAILYQMRARHGSWWVVAERLGAFLTQVGELWASGELSIAEEHTISERLARAIATARQALPAAVDAPVCLFVMAEGDHHTLGLRLAELVAKEVGWRSRWLGRETPLTELSEVLTSGTVQAVAASASAYSANGDQLSKQARTIETMARACEVPLALGGEGSWPGAPRYAQRVEDLQGFRRFLLDIAV